MMKVLLNQHQYSALVNISNKKIDRIGSSQRGNKNRMLTSSQETVYFWSVIQVSQTLGKNKKLQVPITSEQGGRENGTFRIIGGEHSTV